MRKTFSSASTIQKRGAIAGVSPRPFHGEEKLGMRANARSSLASLTPSPSIPLPLNGGEGRSGGPPPNFRRFEWELWETFAGALRGEGGESPFREKQLR